MDDMDTETCCHMTSVSAVSIHGISGPFLHLTKTRSLSHSLIHAACHRDHGVTVISRPSLLTVRPLDSRGGAKQVYSLTGPIDESTRRNRRREPYQISKQ